MEARPKSVQVGTHTGTHRYILIWVMVTQAYTYAKVY